MWKCPLKHSQCCPLQVQTRQCHSGCDCWIVSPQWLVVLVSDAGGCLSGLQCVSYTVGYILTPSSFIIIQNIFFFHRSVTWCVVQRSLSLSLPLSLSRTNTMTVCRSHTDHRQRLEKSRPRWRPVKTSIKFLLSSAGRRSSAKNSVDSAFTVCSHHKRPFLSSRRTTAKHLSSPPPRLIGSKC